MSSHRALPVVLAMACFGLTVSGLAQGAPATRPPDLFPNISDTWLVALLVISGFMLLAVEIKVISYGLLGIGGLACLSGAVLVLLRRPDAFFGIPPALLIAFIIAGSILCIAMALMGYRAQLTRISAGSESFAGQLAEVSRPLNPEGKVFFQGSYWDAVSEVPVEAGATVRIVSADNLRLVVEPVPTATAQALQERPA